MKRQNRHHKFKMFIRQTVGLIFRKNIFLNASAITFNLFICSIPFTLIITSILGYIISFDAEFVEVIRYGRELLLQFSLISECWVVIVDVVTLDTTMYVVDGD